MTPESTSRTIRLNGEIKSTRAATIAELLHELQMPAVGVAVAQNGAVVRRAEHEGALIHENDDIEIIRAVQGG